MSCKIEEVRGIKNLKYTLGEKEKYVYSRYNPKGNIRINTKSKDKILILGLGLGYEIEWLKEQGYSNIIVITDKKEIYQESEEVRERCKDIEIYFENEYKEKIDFIKREKYEIVIWNRVVFESAVEFYKNIIEEVRGVKIKKKILILQRANIAIELKMALEKMGYEVFLEPLFAISNEMKHYIMLNGIDYVFTINFYPGISDICNEIGKEYISWVVDTPCVFYT